MMKTALITIVTVFLAGCASLPPARSTAGWPVRSITVPQLQSVRFAHFGHPEVTIPAGTYVLVYENKWAWYYSMPGVVIIRKDMFTYNEKGGIGCVKDGGRLFMYFTPVRDSAGELVKYMAKRETGDTDDISRVVSGYLTDQDVALWTFTANHSPEPAQSAVH